MQFVSPTHPSCLKSIGFLPHKFPSVSEIDFLDLEIPPREQWVILFYTKEGQEDIVKLSSEGKRPPLSIFLSILLHWENPVIYISSLYLHISSTHACCLPKWGRVKTNWGFPSLDDAFNDSLNKVEMDPSSLSQTSRNTWNKYRLPSNNVGPSWLMSDVSARSAACFWESTTE